MNTISTSAGQTITLSGNGIASVVSSSGGSVLVNRVTATNIGIDEDEDDEDMAEEGDFSDDEGDEDMLEGGSELTTQLAAAGWQHGVMFCLVNI